MPDIKESYSREEVEFAATLMTASLTQSEAMTNRVFENYEATIAEWQKNYAELYLAIENANIKTDSQRIGFILAKNGWKADRAQQAVEKHEGKLLS